MSKRLSIVDKVQAFADLADGIREPDDDNEISELLENIEEHGSTIYEYIKLLEADAAELKIRGDKIVSARKVQENKAKRYKQQLKDAMNLAGFSSFTAGDFRVKVSNSKKLQPSRPPNEKDFVNRPELVIPKFSWNREPEASDKLENGDLVETDFAWDLKAIGEILDPGGLKKKRKQDVEIPSDLTGYVKFDTTTKLLVSVDKKDVK